MGWHGARLVSIEIITNILRMKTILSSLAALFLAQLTASAVVDLGSTIGRTPYDAYMSPVKQVFNSLNGSAPDMGRVGALMRQGRGFRYAHTDPYLSLIHISEPTRPY